jgi:peptide/nickel transport system substrate-binding protein/microcin C transport system substrate-binding protein
MLPNSYYPGSEYESNNPKNVYSPEEALKLRQRDGTRDCRDGRSGTGSRRSSLQRQGLGRWLTVYQNDLRRVGIGLNLRLVNPETRFKLMMQRQFELVSGAWGAGSVFPIPRPQFHSETADVLNTNNISGFKDKRIDVITEQYDLEFDPASEPNCSANWMAL